MARLLVVEDDAELNRTVCAYLASRGHECTGALSAAEAYDALYTGGADLVVSDVMMPGADGFELAESIRSVDADMPILFMTARDDMASKQRGFAAGIDDYMVKPVDLEELNLRVGALLRRAHVNASRRLTVGSLTLDTDERAAYVGGEEVALTAREFDLLHRLLSYPKKTFTRAQLMGEFWEAGGTGGPRAVDVYVAGLRKKLADCADVEIVTVHGLGYKAVPHAEG